MDTNGDPEASATHLKSQHRDRQEQRTQVGIRAKSNMEVWIVQARTKGKDEAWSNFTQFGIVNEEDARNYMKDLVETEAENDLIEYRVEFRLIKKDVDIREVMLPPE